MSWADTSLGVVDGERCDKQANTRSVSRQCQQNKQTASLAHSRTDINYRTFTQWQVSMCESQGHC